MKNYLLLFSLVTVGLVFFGCGKDEPDEMMMATCMDGIQNGTETDIDCGGDCPACITTVEEDKANIQKTFDDMINCVQDMEDSRAVTVFFKKFLNLSNGEVLNQDWIDNLTETLEGVFDGDHIDTNSKLDLNYHKGIYSFDAVNNVWTKSTTTEDKIIFNFPAEPALLSNNLEVGLDLYTDKRVTIDEDVMSLPTAMHAYINIDGIKAFEISLSDVVYAENADYELPVEATFQLFMDPMEINISVDRVNSTSYEMDMNFSDGNLCDIGVHAEMELKDDDFENLSTNSLKTANVTIDIGDLSIRTLGDLATLLAIDDPSDAQVNNLLDLTVFFQDLKIADLEIDQEDESFIIFYKDGSSEDTEVFHDDFWEDIRVIWNKYFGE